MSISYQCVYTAPVCVGIGVQTASHGGWFLLPSYQCFTVVQLKCSTVYAGNCRLK